MVFIQSKTVFRRISFFLLIYFCCLCFHYRAKNKENLKKIILEKLFFPTSSQVINTKEKKKDFFFFSGGTLFPYVKLRNNKFGEKKESDCFFSGGPFFFVRSKKVFGKNHGKTFLKIERIWKRLSWQNFFFHRFSSHKHRRRLNKVFI